MDDRSAAPYYRQHIFFCIKDRGDGRESCGARGGRAAFELCKAAVKEAGLGAREGVRVNQTSCLDRCGEGPVAVVYPQGTWYTFVDEADVSEIVSSHLMDDVVVTRLSLAPCRKP